MSDDRYEIVTFHGKRVDKYTRAALLAVEKELGYELTIVQGSYNAGGVSASAGTHDGGGVVDLAPTDRENKVKALRKHGFAAWYRPTLPGVWGAHIHAVLIGNAKLSRSAANQVTAYRNRRDGLKGNAVDNTWRPATIKAFAYVVDAPVENHVTRGRELIEQGLAELDKASPKRKVVHRETKVIRERLKNIPKK